MLTNGQYEEFMRIYASRRDKNARLLKQRREEVVSRIPAFRDLEEMSGQVALKALRQQLMPDTDDPGDSGIMSARDELERIRIKKREVLTENGYPADYLDPVYDCPDCRDTGFIDTGRGRTKCHCFRQMELGILYDHSRLSLLIKTNNFDLLREDYYEGESLLLFRNALSNCRTFLDTFDEAAPNLLFYGPTGTGKSFLSICTAGEILKRGKTVLYFSAADVLEKISGYAQNAEEKQQIQDLVKELSETELLVLDDLGTEINNSFISSRLFTIINERILKGLSTVISTNLPLDELRSRYSDRVFSRITSNYLVCKLTGPDIRMSKIIRK